MRIATSKMRQILYLTVIGLVMLAIIAPINAPTSKTVSARTQQPAYVKAGAFTDMDTVLSRIFPFYKADSFLNMGRNGVDARSFLFKLGLSNKLIVPVQEPGKTSVPFKGWITKEGIAKEGTVSMVLKSMVLKIYDQANGGTKLYEGIHEVEVTNGQYFAIIQVPSETIAKSQTIWLEAASVEQKELAFEPRESFERLPEGLGPNAQIVTGVGLCYSCGGPAPYWQGTIPVQRYPYEYDRKCAGPVNTRIDYNPMLCANVQYY